MRIDRTAFGEITIDGKTYDHDVIVRTLGRRCETQEEVVETAIRHLSYRVGRRGTIRVRKGMQANNSRLGPRGKCAPLPGGGGLLREKGLPGRDPTHAAGDSSVQ